MAKVTKKNSKLKQREELPLPTIYDKAVIGEVNSAWNSLPFTSAEDAEVPIPVYNLDIVSDICLREMKKSRPMEPDPEDEHYNWLGRTLPRCRAIFVREMKDRRRK